MPGVRPLASSALPERQSPPPNLTPNPPTLSFNAHIGITKLSIHTKHTYNANRYNKYVCMHACRHVCMYVCMHVYVCICMYLYAYMYVYIYMYMQLKMYIHHPRIHELMHLHLHLELPLHKHTHIQITIHTHIYIYIHRERETGRANICLLNLLVFCVQLCIYSTYMHIDTYADGR